jgi:MFS family permease
MFFAKHKNYFSHELNREIIELYWNTALFNLSTNLAYIFEPIFLYQLHYSLVQIMYFYLILYIAYAILVFPATKITSKIGYKHAIFISTIFYVFYWAVLYQIKFYPALFLAAPVLYALQKSFYWPAYNADVALSNVKDQRGREVGVLFSVVELAAIVGPIIGGFVSFQFGFMALFGSAAILMLLSAYPLFLSPEIFTTHSFRFKNFMSVVRAYPANFFAYWGYAEDLMLMSLWPIFIYLIVPELFSIGLIITFASLIAVMLMLYLGKLLDEKKRSELLPIGATFYGLTWLFRFFAQTMGGIVGFDVATRLGKAMVNVPMQTITFEIAGKKGPDFAIAYAVFFEFSLSIGKVITALVAIGILSTTGSMVSVFMVVGVLTMFYSFLKR